MTESTQDIAVGDDVPAASIFDVFETDATAIENGKWFDGEDLGLPVKGMKFKIRRFTSKASQKARADLNSKYRTLAKKGKFSDEVEQKILEEQLAKAILVGWDGVLDRDKQPIPFSEEAALSLIRKLPDLRLMLTQVALDIDRFRVEERAEISGN